MKNKILTIIILILLINCKGQDKDVEKENLKTEKITLSNSIFLGVDKINGLYTVYDRCDGGYPSLHFKENEFYFYSPQEGTNYLIKNIIFNNNKYIIKTGGYYFIRGETTIKQEDTWYLEKQNDLLWSFKNKKWQKTIIFSDSLNIRNKKIAYKIQPCKECSEDCDEKSIDNKLLGKWGANCENPIGITIKENELIMTVEPNQYYIHLTKIQSKTQKDFISYKLQQLEGSGSEDIYSEAYLNNSEILRIKNLNNNKIELNWLGFYNKVNKQRQYTDPMISNENPTILEKCHE